MGILSKKFHGGEEEHWQTVLRAGGIGGTVGVGGGGAAVWAAARRFAVVRGLTVPFRAFLVSSAGVFGAVTAAERASVAFERGRAPAAGYVDAATRAAAAARAGVSAPRRAAAWVVEHKLPLTLGVWASGMAAALALVGRDRYATTTQKVAQARVYAQGITLAAILAIAAFGVLAPDKDGDNSGSDGATGRRKGHEAGREMWQDMVVTEERRLAALKASKTKEHGAEPAPASQQEQSSGPDKKPAGPEEKPPQLEKKSSGHDQSVSGLT